MTNDDGTSQTGRRSRPEDGPRQDSSFGETMAHGEETSSRFPGVKAPGASTAEQWIGRRLDRYELRSLLGTGGMGIVFLAHDTTIERDVAIKMLPQELSTNETALARFLSEAKAAGKLSHPNTVGVYEVDQEGDTFYLVMEYVGGGTIGEELERGGALSVLAATQITADACRGLAAAHRVGLVHRDIKPANLLRSGEGAVKIADFGLAKHTLDTTMSLTREGSVAGTPYFMSPEQCESRAVDARSDIYSLGATYYSLLTGAYPYQDAGSIVQIMFAHVSGEPLDPRKVVPTIPAACAHIVQRATAKRPEDRYQNAEEMLADLNAVIATLSGATDIALPSRSGINPVARPLAPQGTKDRTSRRAWMAVAGLGALGAAAGVGGFVLLRDDKPQPESADAPNIIPPPAGTPIRVGVLHSLTGSMQASEAPVVDATLLAIEELNDAGGVLGRPVEAIVRDGRSNPEVFATEARNLIADEKVCTVFGCWTSASRKTVVPIFERHDNLLVYPVQYEGLEDSPNVIYLGAVPNQQIIPALGWAFAFQRKRRFFLVGSDYVFPRTAGAIIRDELNDLGAEIVGEEYLPLGAFEVQGIIDQIVESKPDMILNTINGDTNVPFFRRLRAAGITPEKTPTISFSIAENELQQFDPATMAGDFAAWNYFQSLNSLENQRFVERFRAKYDQRRVVTDPMEVAYVGVRMWGNAVREAGSDRCAKIRQAFGNQKLLAPEGELTIDATNRHTFKTPRIGKISSDGQFEVVWSEVKAERPIPFPETRTRQEWEAFLADLYAGWGNQWSAPSR